jgi:hypothetical protein
MPLPTSVYDNKCTRKYHAQFFFSKVAPEKFGNRCCRICIVHTVVVWGMFNLSPDDQTEIFFLLILFYENRQYTFSYNFHVLKI